MSLVKRISRTPAPAPTAASPQLTGDDQRGRVLPWAVLPSTLAAIATVLRRDLQAGAPLDPTALDALRTITAQASADTETAVSPGVAVLSLRGLITARPSYLSFLFGGGSGLLNFRDCFREAISDDDISAILIDIDSPGGSTDLVPEVAREIREARGAKPIVAIANTMAASAAYYIGVQADEFVITPSGFAGSVGVYAIHEDWSKFNEEFGVLPTYISAGKYKTEGNPDEPLSDDARAAWQDTVDDMYEMFVADVAAARGATEAAVRSGFGEGRVLTAQRCVDAGMADGIETYDDVVDRLLGNPPETGSAAAVALARQQTAAAQLAQQLATTAHPELAAALRTHLGLDEAATNDEVLAALRASDTETSPPGPEPDPALPPAEREDATPDLPGWLLLPKPRH